MKYLILLVVVLTQIFSGDNIKKDETPVAIFTEEEIAYLKQKKEITVCEQKNWTPYINFRGEKPKGILPELIDVYGSVIGIPIKYVKTSNWNECAEKTKNRSNLEKS